MVRCCLHTFGWRFGGIFLQTSLATQEIDGSNTSESTCLFFLAAVFSWEFVATTATTEIVEIGFVTMETAVNDGQVKAVDVGDHRRTSTAGGPGKYWVGNITGTVGSHVGFTSSDHR